jgi:hypothetical protein
VRCTGVFPAPDVCDFAAGVFVASEVCDFAAGVFVAGAFESDAFAAGFFASEDGGVCEAGACCAGACALSELGVCWALAFPAARTHETSIVAVIVKNFFMSVFSHWNPESANLQNMPPLSGSHRRIAHPLHFYTSYVKYV